MTAAERSPTLDALKPYPAYKDSGVEWIGEIPTTWDVVPVRQLFENRQVLNKNEAETNVLSLSYGRIVERDVSSNDGLIPASFSTYQLIQRGDVVIRSTDLQNDQRSLRTGLATQDGIITAAYLRLCPKGILSSYAHQLLNAADRSKAFYQIGGGVRQSLKFNLFRELLLPYAPPAEQLAIAAFLDHETARIDALVREQELLLEDLAEKRQSTITSAVMAGIRPRLAQRTDIPWMPLIPQHWSVTPLKHLAQFQGGLTPPDEPQFWNGDVPWVTPKDMKRPVITDTEDKVTAAAVAEGRLKLFKPGCLLMVVRSGILRHTVPVAINAASVTVNQDMKVLQTVAEVRAKFLYYFFEGLGPSLLPVIQKVGATVESINMAALRNLQMPVPPLDDQDDIISHLDHVLAQIDNLAAEVRANIEDMKLLRSTLITAATTGKIDVRDWRPT